MRGCVESLRAERYFPVAMDALKLIDGSLFQR